jgi:hypothetical protein
VDDGVASTIARNTDDYSVKLNFDATPLNNRGEVLFSARSGPALQVPTSLYVRDRQTTCRVLGAGDTLFDKRIDDLGPVSINDHGEVLLWTYSADDDRIAVVVGTPRGRKCTTR